MWPPIMTINRGRLRETFENLGVERSAGHSEPEDHVAIVCEIMAGLIGGDIAGTVGADREFFESHLAPWIRRFFVDLERARSADFYACVGSTNPARESSGAGFGTWLDDKTLHAGALRRPRSCLGAPH
jgi:hypothetical protein